MKIRKFQLNESGRTYHKFDQDFSLAELDHVVLILTDFNRPGGQGKKEMEVFAVQHDKYGHADLVNFLCDRGLDSQIVGVYTRRGMPNLATDGHRLLRPDEEFVDGDEALEKNGQTWFPIVDSVGKTLQDMPGWVAARRPRLVL